MEGFELTGELGGILQVQVGKLQLCDYKAKLVYKCVILQ